MDWIALANEPSRVYDLDVNGIRNCLGQMRECFESHFDQNWLLLLMDELPLNSRDMPEIRELLEQATSTQYDLSDLKARIPLVDNFIKQLVRYLLPGLREKLGISRLLPIRRIRDKRQLLLREFIAYTFPTNLARLSHLTRKLKSFYPDDELP